MEYIIYLLLHGRKRKKVGTIGRKGGRWLSVLGFQCGRENVVSGYLTWDDLIRKYFFRIAMVFRPSLGGTSCRKFPEVCCIDWLWKSRKKTARIRLLWLWYCKSGWGFGGELVCYFGESTLNPGAIVL